MQINALSFNRKKFLKTKEVKKEEPPLPPRPSKKSSQVEVTIPGDHMKIMLRGDDLQNSSLQESRNEELFPISHQQDSPTKRVKVGGTGFKKKTDKNGSVEEKPAIPIKNETFERSRTS